MWTAVATLSLLSALVAAPPEYDGSVWRVYPGDQRYYYQDIIETGGAQQSPRQLETPKKDAATPPVVITPPVAKTPPEKKPVKPAIESSFIQGLRRFVDQQPRDGAKAIITKPVPSFPARQEIIQPFQKELVVEYKINVFRLTPAQKKKITSYIETLRQAAGIRVDAYADMTGSARYNMLLTAKRAKEVQNLLIALGIDRNKIRARGLGQTNILPKGQNSRRTEIWVRNDGTRK